MALFGFSDISFNRGPATRKGPLAPLVGSQFERTTLRYPLDIGNYDKGHYVVFYVREQKETSKSRDVKGEITSLTPISGTSVKNLNDINGLAANFGNEILGKINSGLSQFNGATGGALSGLTSQLSAAASRGVSGITSGITSSVNNIFGQSNVKFGGSSAETQAVIETSIKRITGGRSILDLRTTRLTKDAIALYMPDTLNYTYAQSYDQLNLGSELGGQAIAAAQSVIDAYKEGNTTGALGAAAKTAVEIGKQKVVTGLAGALGSSQTGQAILAATGRVQNPMLEMVYKSPNFRTFQFDFVFYPRDEREALEVQRILERFRYHQAPEIMKGAQGFLIPPSEFDIVFYYGGGENPNIPKIATCVLTNFDVNYAPNGFSAYEVPGENSPNLGRTGMPTSIQVAMQFQETTYLTKADFNEDLTFTDTLARGK